ncbi:MAG: hypothetical protein M3I41_08385 [Actinomyces graevenitzii]|uniref:Uncharacterized protein n=1 Tax=Actinomyces graevenitzii TaxID=55565 RepID=A0A9E7D6L0_9ACTO|nr:MAG: hypothetical protein M3I41_08385 [Actinomyces graevenitzii]
MRTEVLVFHPNLAGSRVNAALANAARTALHVTADTFWCWPAPFNERFTATPETAEYQGKQEERSPGYLVSR